MMAKKRKSVKSVKKTVKRTVKKSAGEKSVCCNNGGSTLNAKNFGLAAGYMWGVGLLVSTWISMGTGWAGGFLEMWGSLYPGYSISFLGGLLGGVYGFVDGFIMAYVVAWLYNWHQKCCK